MSETTETLQQALDAALRSRTSSLRDAMAHATAQSAGIGALVVEARGMGLDVSFRISPPTTLGGSPIGVIGGPELVPGGKGTKPKYEINFGEYGTDFFAYPASERRPNAPPLSLMGQYRPEDSYDDAAEFLRRLRSGFVHVLLRTPAALEQVVLPEPVLY